MLAPREATSDPEIHRRALATSCRLRDIFMSPRYPGAMPNRTTFRLDEEILSEAKAAAARQHRSLNSVMEEALRRWLAVAQELATRPPVELTTSGTPGGGPHLTPADIKDILEQQDIEHFLEVTADDARGHERPDLRPSA